MRATWVTSAGMLGRAATSASRRRRHRGVQPCRPRVGGFFGRQPALDTGSSPVAMANNADRSGIDLGAEQSVISHGHQALLAEYGPPQWHLPSAGGRRQAVQEETDPPTAVKPSVTQPPA